MKFVNFLRNRLRRVSSPPSPPSAPTETRDFDTPPLRRRSMHRRRSSATASPPESTAPPFRRRDSSTKRSGILETPLEIAESVSYAKTCSSYLCGQAGSVAALVHDPTAQTGRGPEKERKEAFEAAKQNLLAEFEVFEKDHVAWAGYLMEGSSIDDGDAERGRLFVREGREVMLAVERAREEVDRIVAL